MISNLFVSSIGLKDGKRKNGDYPFSLPIVKDMENLVFSSPITIFTGENGTGKSTVVEAIAFKYGFNLEGGSRNFNFETKKISSLLGEELQLARGYKRPRDDYFFRAESFYNLASNIDDIGVISSYGGVSLHDQSHGESFFSLFLNRLRGEGFYLFDEPEAALSPQRQLAFLARMDELIGEGSQFIIATHSPIIMSHPKAEILQFSDEGIRKVRFEETDCFDFYKTFMNNYGDVLRRMGLGK
ncbi:MAG: AAA family ATPase [Candidatus Pacebacteria bacterium]|nr:AAA family ATPase [Candidatus Paceibacterota bacterium]